MKSLKRDEDSATKKEKVQKKEQKNRKTLRKMNSSVKTIKSKQQGHMNVIEILVKDAETLISDTEDFSQKKFSRFRAMKKTWGFAVSDGKI